MDTLILFTKVHIPQPRSDLVNRPRLIEQLNQGIQKKLTLVSAPAGFGKTMLVADWIQSVGKGPIGVDNIAWLSLDESENDPVQFITYFVEALTRSDGMDVQIGDGLQDMVQSPQIAQSEVFLITLINEMTRMHGRTLFVLDDYHRIQSQVIDQMLTFLLEHLPPMFHLVITTREDPNLPLARLRARNQLSELRARDLRFSSDEVGEFFNQIMELNLTVEEISLLDTRTEGWIAGLQLAAISMRTLPDANAFIHTFTGSNRYILDYLIEEVLQQQSEKIQTFMLQTSILDRLSGPLCNAITGQENGQEILEMLEHANLFIVPLDNERRWYRYHHLFAELLRQRLHHTFSDQLTKLHLRASEWYENENFLKSAIRYAFDANDISRVIRLVKKGSFNALERSDIGFIVQAVERIPSDMLEQSPWLYVYYCWGLLLTGRVEAIAGKLDDTDWLIEALPEGESDLDRMYGYIAGLKTMEAAWKRDSEKQVFYANQAKKHLPGSHWIIGYSEMSLGTHYCDQGNLSAAVESYTNAMKNGRANGNTRVAVTGCGYLGRVLELKGELQQAIKIYQEGYQFTLKKGTELTVACYMHIDSARAYCELNELELAKEHILKAVHQSQYLADARVENLANSIATRIFLADGALDEAVNYLLNAEKFTPSPGIVYDMRGGEYPNVRIWLEQNNVQELRSWLLNETIDLNASVSFRVKMTYTMHARVMIRLAREFANNRIYLLRAMDLLVELLALARENEWRAIEIEVLVLQALVFDLLDEKSSALSALNEALVLAEPGGFVRVFVDEGPPMAHLLHDIMKQATDSSYIRQLISVFPILNSETPAPERAGRYIPGLFEQLSEREIEVLRLIADGLSRQEIAEELILSMNTVKTHARNIYRKLDVNNQMQAVGKARGLGLLDIDLGLEN